METFLLFMILASNLVIIGLMCRTPRQPVHQPATQQDDRCQCGQPYSVAETVGSAVQDGKTFLQKRCSCGKTRWISAS